MNRFLIINGPNLNLIGRREPEIYGSRPLDVYLEALAADHPGVEIECFQSNHEGAIIDRLQLADGEGIKGIILNAGAYTHTSLAIADAIAAISVPVVEVHISNIYSREPAERRRSLLSGVCRGVIAGLGLDVYRLGLEALMADA